MPSKTSRTSSAPKSHKANGAPKQRWSAAQRAERNRPPRRSSGRNADASFDRDTRRSGPNREERRSTNDRQDWRADRGRTDAPRTERPRTEHTDRPYERSDRSGSDRNGSDRRTFDRSSNERSSNGGDRTFSDRSRTERPYERNDRPRTDRNERTDRGERSWTPRPERDDRRRDSRPEQRRSFSSSERSFDRSDRYDRPDRFDRSDRSDRGFDRPREDNPDQMSWAGADATDIEPTTHAPVSGDNGFAGLGVPNLLVQALAAGGITDPFPIQAATIPDALAGRDVLGRGRTGSGKTLGFGLPMLARLSGATAKAGTARGVVLVPTRELALQVADVLAPLARTVGLSVTLVTGGMAYGPQLKAFSQGVDIVVATPGRLIDLLDQGAADLSRVEITVLDEADHMADLGFLPAVTQLLDTVPGGGQRLLFSATLDHAIDRLVKRYLSQPVTHETDPDQASVTLMSHHVLHVKPFDKVGLTAELAGRPGRTVAFVRTQRGADRVAQQLRESGVLAGALHGGLTQGARARILAAFKDGKLPVLVATDVAARGIHVDEVGLVLQIDPPAGPKDYLHRAGRTARAGEPGTVVTLTLPHQRREVRKLTEQAGVKAEGVEASTGDERLTELVGAQVPTGVAIEQSTYEQVIAPPQRGGGGKRGGGQRRPGGRPAGRGRRSFNR